MSAPMCQCGHTRGSHNWEGCPACAGPPCDLSPAEHARLALVDADHPDYREEWKAWDEALRAERRAFAAKAWDEGYEAASRDDMYVNVTLNPYRTVQENAQRGRVAFGDTEDQA